MSVEYRDGNLLKQIDLPAIAHQANCFTTFGAGIAREIKNTFPEAYEADLATESGDDSKLGTFSKGYNADSNLYIYNLYSQYVYARGIRVTSYDAMIDGLEKIIADMKLNNISVLGVPARIGCGIAGGNWNIVQAILNSLFADREDIHLVIVDIGF